MKKILLTVFAVLLLLTVCGCGETETEPSSGNHTSGSASKDVLVWCGDRSVAPLQGFSGSEKETKEEDGLMCVCIADGYGLSKEIPEIKKNPSSCPALIVDAPVSVESSSGRGFGKPRVYDLNYEELNISVSWDSLHTLPEGEYFIHFFSLYEKEYEDGSNESGAYEHIFRLILD
ncbi:MAG: hypothetical protein IJC19_01580 [Clostridia bacterium]|nr:hypothetical protein [Clostridia bacterium]